MRISKQVRLIGAAALLVAMTATAGCVRVPLADGGFTSIDKSVQAEGATELKATIQMGAGVLKVKGGAADLLNATFDFSDPSWEPQVDYSVSSGTGELNVKSPERINFTPPRNSRDTRYEWDLALTDALPLDLAVDMGAGEATLDLRGTDLRDLTVNLGAGKTTIDLSDSWTNDVSADIKAGAGQLIVKVPADVGVRVVGYRDGLGSYSADGFKQDGDALVNDAWGTASVKLDIVLRRGVGDVRIETVQ